MTKKKVLSLFSGCGGMDLGFEGGFRVNHKCVNTNIHKDWLANKTKEDWVELNSTSFETVFANDILPYAKAAWISHFEGRHEDVFHLDSIVDLVNKNYDGEDNFSFPDKIDVVTGGFPCNDFSVSGYRKGFDSHKSHKGVPLSSIDEPTTENRGMLYIWMRKVIDIVRPKVFMAENVKGLVSLADVKTVIENDFRNIGKEGYLVIEARVLHAGDYGVPQSRERVIFIGFNKSALEDKAAEALAEDIVPEEYDPYPRRTHSASQDRDPNLLKIVTCMDVLADLSEPNESEDPDQQAYSKAKYYGRHCQGQVEIKRDGLGPTIRAEHHGNIEFRRLYKKRFGKKPQRAGKPERRLTVRECARIQTFPNDYSFVSKETKISTSDAYRLIGNAVPPLLAYHLARRLEELWDKLFT